MTAKFDYILTAARELQTSSIETVDNLREFVVILRETGDLYAVDRCTTNSPLISLGFTLLVLPDPISTPIGAGMIMAGLAQQRLVGPPLYIKDVYECFNQNVLDLLKDSDFARAMSITSLPSS